MAASSVVRRRGQDDPVLCRGGVRHLYRDHARGLCRSRCRRGRPEPALRRSVSMIGGNSMAKTALVVGAGDGISASFARALAREGITVGLAARRTDKLAALRDEIGGPVFACDAADPHHVAPLF